MKVKDVMMRTPYACHPESNLGTVAELMWRGNCGFLPIVDSKCKITGVITDRDVCIALGTRNVPAGGVQVREVVHNKPVVCSPENTIQEALRIMRDSQVRRLPVVNAESKVVGIISLHDVLFRAEPAHFGKEPELAADEIVHTYRVILQRDLPVKAKSATA